MPTRRKPIFVRPIDLGTIATGNEVAGHEAELLDRKDTLGLTWKTAGNADVWARGELSVAADIDFMSVIAANALPGTQIRLRLGTSQVEVDGGSAPYDSGSLSFISPTPAATPEDGLYHSHLELPAIENATWWRIDVSGHTGDFEAASLIMGRKIEPSRFYNVDHSFGTQDLGSLDIGRWGVPDEKDGLVYSTLDFALGWQTEDEFETEFRPLAKALGQRKLLYCCFDPEPSGYRQARTALGFQRKRTVAKGVRKPGTYTQEFSILSMI